MTLRVLFDVIAYGSQVMNPTTPLPLPTPPLTPPITHQLVVKFVNDAGVKDGWFIKGASDTAKEIMDTFGDATGTISWERFQAKGLQLLPGGVVAEMTAERAGAEIEKRWAEIDPKGTGAVSISSLKDFIEKSLDAGGVKFSGVKADISSKVLMHALDVAPRDKLLQKEELKSFLIDAVNEAKAVKK